MASGVILTATLVRLSPCDTPIAYRVDTVDPKFNLTREEFVKDIADAQQIWSKAYRKNIFVYDPKGKLSINMVFDERSQLRNDITTAETSVKSQEQNLKPQIADYEAQVAVFKQKLADFNTQVNYWNAKGGAPKDTYDQLNQQQEALKNEANRLNALANQLNQTTTNFNAQVDNLNQTVDTFNTDLTMRPEEGVYDPGKNSITIYFNIDKQELVHTLAHELGHALTMDHVNNKEAIMYPRTNTTLTPLSEDLSQLQKVCQTKPLWEIGLNFVKLNIARG